MKLKSLIIAITLTALCAHSQEPINPCLKQMEKQRYAAMPALSDIDYGKLSGKVDEKKKESYIENFSIAPVAALKTVDLNGKSTFGVGADVGIGINKFVSIHGAAYGFEDPDNWRGGVVDEGELYGRANFVRFAQESFTFFGKGGLNYDFGREDLGFGVGAGLELKFNEYLAAGVDYTIRAHFDSDKDSLARVFISGTF